MFQKATEHTMPLWSWRTYQHATYTHLLIESKRTRDIVNQKTSKLPCFKKSPSCYTSAGSSASQTFSSLLRLAVCCVLLPPCPRRSQHNCTHAAGSHLHHFRPVAACRQPARCTLPLSRPCIPSKHTPAAIASAAAVPTTTAAAAGGR
jgi:hypothetical protein